MSELFPEAFYVDGDAASEAVRDLYNALAAGGVLTHSVDTISYTEDFERLYQRIQRRFPLTRNEVFVMLMNRRKRGECKAPNGR